MTIFEKRPANFISRVFFVLLYSEMFISSFFLRILISLFISLTGLRKENPSDEAAWSLASMGGQSNLPPRPDRSQRGSAWPFLMFVGLVIGAPWLMFKLLSKTLPKKPLGKSQFDFEKS